MYIQITAEVIDPKDGTYRAIIVGPVRRFYYAGEYEVAIQCLEHSGFVEMKGPPSRDFYEGDVRP